MPRVPTLLVIFLCLGVIALAWWRGTRDYDFLTPPSDERIALARTRATSDLDRPADLFGMEDVEPTPLEPIKPPAPPPAPKPETPIIARGDTSGDPPLDAYADQAGVPAASFINLASRLEAETLLAWALPAWERVLDRSSPDSSEQEAALNGVRRLRTALPPWNEDRGKARPIVLHVEAPADRLTLARRAVKEAAAAIESASSGTLAVEPAIQRNRDKQAAPDLKIFLGGPDPTSPVTGSVAIPAPATEAEILAAVLSAALKLVSSQLALAEGVTPPSPPAAGESPADSLQIRVTRLSWQTFADQLQTADSP